MSVAVLDSVQVLDAVTRQLGGRVFPAPRGPWAARAKLSNCRTSVLLLPGGAAQPADPTWAFLRRLLPGGPFPGE